MPPLPRLFSLVFLLVLLAAGTLPSALRAECSGRNLLAGMTAEQRASLDAAVGREPFASGNHWKATRGDSTIHLIGTFHIYDARMDAHMRKLMPVLHAADQIFLEATEAEIAALQKAVAEKPDLMFTMTGPTLPDRLSADEWQHLSAEMEARGIPAFFAAKFRPWFVTVMLGVPPCAMDQMTTGSSGLDHLIMTAAAEMGTPTVALEPFDTVFQAFGAMTDDEQIEMVRASLALAGRAEDMFSTMLASYFSENHRQIWEMSRQQALEAAGPDRARAEDDFALMEKALVNDRNHAWMQPILAAAPGETLVVAVGAGHLAGHDGLLNLLAEAGYTLERQPF